MNNSRSQTYGALIIIALASICLLSFHFIQNNINRKMDDVQSSLTLRKNILEQAKNNAEKQMVERDVHSSSFNKKQAAATSILKHQSNRLFDLLLTYNNQSDWDSSRQKAADMLTPEAKASNKGAFNNGKDISGNSIIKTEGLRSSLITSTVTSSLINNNVISGLVKVKYMASVRGGNNGFSIDYYYVTYDLDTAKFTGVSRLGSLGSYSDN